MPPYAPNSVVFKQHKVGPGRKHAGMYHVQAVRGQYATAANATGYSKEAVMYKGRKLKKEKNREGYHKKRIHGFQLVLPKRGNSEKQQRYTKHLNEFKNDAVRKKVYHQFLKKASR